MDRRTTDRMLVVALAMLVGLPTVLAAQSPGRLVGRVLDARTGEPLASVQVYVSDGSRGALTALDGRYVLRDVPAGAHEITAQLIGYGTKTVTGVVVGPGATATLDITLESRAVELEAITVTSTAQRGTTTALMTERRLAAVVSDAIGVEQISRSPDGDAAAALERVPGLTVVDGKYAYVRGLGERYSATTLNGAPLASSEPDKKVIPLDVIPSGLLQSIVTAKSYSPDQPGDHAGGLVQLRTQRFPPTRILNVRVSGGWNSEATFQERLGYGGGARDYLGFDDGTRGLPAVIPRDARVGRGNFTQAELQEMGRAFRGDWAPTQRSLPPNSSFGISFGDDYDLGGPQRFGFIASANYASDQSVRTDVVERVFATAGAADPEVDYTGEVADHAVTLGGLVNLTYQPAPRHQLELATVYNHLANDVSRVLTGFNLDSNTDQWNSRIQFLEQTLLNTQLEGEHLFGFLGDATLRWRGGFTRASRYEPSTREALYREFDGTFVWDDFIQSGSVFHQDLVDDGFTGGGSVKLPFRFQGASASVSVGGSFERKDRTAYTRRFRFRPQSGGLIDSEVRTLAPNRLFGAPGSFIDPSGFELQEATFRTDNYDAVQEIDAGYVMLDLEVLDGVRLSGGVRAERSLQTVTPKDLWETGLPPIEGAELEATAILPAVNVTLALDESVNLRASASRTLARPHLRELAPFSFADYAGGYLVIGNPLLEGTRINNFDLRLEWFPEARSVLAVSGFYKRFESPIEVAVLPSSELLKTWVNGAGGNNYGLELELRSGLGVIASGLSDLSLNGNLTLVRSEVSTGGTIEVYLPGTGATQLALTPEDRALQGQSPYVANVGLTWAPLDGATATLLFNRFGERIDAVAADALEDVFESARSQLDAVVELPLRGGWKAKLAASRLVGSDVEFTQGDDLLRSYDMGRSVSFGLSWGAGR